MPPHLFSKFLVLQGLRTKATCALYSNCNTRKERGQKECPAVRADIVGYWAAFCSTSTGENRIRNQLLPLWQLTKGVLRNSKEIKYRVILNDCRGFNNCHLVLQMQPHVISFYGVRSRIRFMFLLFPQVSRNWRYESEPPLKPSPLTCYKQFGTNSIIVLMFVESQRVYI